ncbi:MAG: flagellar assembly protein FliW [Thermaerobacter sp.]|nr:flagellar assembly protein FliW [Thermaerobacter sp.]
MTKRISSSRLGELELSTDEIINFSEGFLGLPTWQEALLRQTEVAPYLLWLQFTHDQEAAFLLLDIEQVLPDYDLALARTAAGTSPAAKVYAIISVPGGLLAKATANLLAPVVIDSTLAPQGRQVVLHDTAYPLRHPLFTADETEDEPC